MSAVPVCRGVTVHLFQGTRGALARGVRKALDDQAHGRGPGPTPLECRLSAGHTGVAVDAEPNVIRGFNPHVGADPLWQVMQWLRNGDAYPGVVTDDAGVFVEARKRKFAVLMFEVVLPEPAFQAFERTLTRERRRSQYSYGFPDGDGDCNCVRWLERLALPLLSGSMDEFAAATAVNRFPRRRFGRCR